MADETEDAFPLLEYLDELVDALRELIPKAIRDQDVDAVHDARVTTRRLKAAVDLMEPLTSKSSRKPFGNVTRKLRRQLGPLRDLDVMLEHLNDFAKGRHAAAVAWLIARLTNIRAAAVQSAKDQIPPSRVLAKLGTWWGLRQEILDAKAATQYRLAEGVHLQLDYFVEQADGLVSSSSIPLTEKIVRNDPHELRIAGKALRYTLEMAGKQGQQLPRGVMALFKRVQECLGIWHDYIVLTERMLCETVECDLALHDPALQGQILGLAQVTLKKASVELKKVADFWAKRGEELTKKIRGNFPLSVAANATQEVPTEPIRAVEIKLDPGEHENDSRGTGVPPVLAM